MFASTTAMKRKYKTAFILHCLSVLLIALNLCAEPKLSEIVDETDCNRDKIVRVVVKTEGCQNVDESNPDDPTTNDHLRLAECMKDLRRTTVQELDKLEKEGDSPLSCPPIRYFGCKCRGSETGICELSITETLRTKDVFCDPADFPPYCAIAFRCMYECKPGKSTSNQR